MSIKSDIERIAEEEERIQFERFEFDRAHNIGAALHEEAKRRGAAVTIDVTAFGQQLFHLAMAGTAPDNDRWIERKHATVLRFGKSSLRVGRELASEKLSIEERYQVSAREFAPNGGSFPIRLTGGGVIGAVAVSGLTQEEDHELAVSVLEQFTHA